MANAEPCIMLTETNFIVEVCTRIDNCKTLRRYNGRGHKLDQPFAEWIAEQKADLICDLAQCLF